MKKVNLVGIDVSAKTFTVVIDDDGARSEAFDLDNDPKGHRKLIRMITKKGFHARVVLEATGNYSLDIALALHRAPRVEVMVANPRAVSQFAGAYLRRSKTDAIDANVLVEFAARMPFEPWKPPSAQAFDLRAISRRIEALTKTSTQEKNRLHAATSFDEMSDVVREDIEINIRHLEDRIERLRDQARALIAKHPDLERAFQHITSVKGIATAAGSSSWPSSPCCRATWTSASGWPMPEWIRARSSRGPRSTDPRGSVVAATRICAEPCSCLPSWRRSTNRTSARSTRSCSLEARRRCRPTWP